MNNFKNVIDKFLEHQAIIEIEYIDKKLAISKRLILPMYWKSASIIVAYCFLREDDRHFNINNIISAKEVGEETLKRLPHSLNPRKVEFPSNEYFGELFLIGSLDRTLLYPFDYQVNINRGKVLVPPNKNLCLSTAEFAGTMKQLNLVLQRYVAFEKTIYKLLK